MKYYFASDMHLGLGLEEDSKKRERLLVRWLDEVSKDATAIYLMGDLFDFWYEYKRVVPKGFVRLLGKLAELTDRGVEIHVYAGNHDMWMGDYLIQECGVKVHTSAEVVELCGKRVLLAHGDGLGNDGWLFKLMNGFFHSGVARWLFSRVIHPDLGLKFGSWWSKSSRLSSGIKNEFRGENENIVKYARRSLERGDLIDLFICGHTHCRVAYPLNEQGVETLFLGEWVLEPGYAVMEDGVVQLYRYEK